MQQVNQLVGNVWEAVAPIKLPGLRLDHRMTVIRLSNGELLIHSPIAFAEPLRAEILQLGIPAWFVAPSRFHDMFWPEWFRAFPNARFLAVPGFDRDHPELPFTDILDQRSRFGDGEVTAVPLRGLPGLNEVLLYHQPSRSLIMADLIFNIAPQAQNIFGRLFLRLNGVYHRPGVSRIFRSYIKDKPAFIDSLHEIQSYPFERMIIGHGKNLGGNSELARAASAAGLSPQS